MKSKKLIVDITSTITFFMVRISNYIDLVNEIEE
jgi:hypothetical protein